MIRKVTMEVWECVCEVPGCPRDGKPWHSLGERPPPTCSTCKSREWNGKKIPRRPVPKIGIELPKPTRVRQTDEPDADYPAVE